MPVVPSHPPAISWEPGLDFWDPLSPAPVQLLDSSDL